MTTENRTRSDAIADYLPLVPRGVPRLKGGLPKSRLARNWDYARISIHTSAITPAKFKARRGANVEGQRGNGFSRTLPASDRAFRCRHHLLGALQGAG